MKTRGRQRSAIGTKPWISQRLRGDKTRAPHGELARELRLLVAESDQAALAAHAEGRHSVAQIYEGEARFYERLLRGNDGRPG